MLREIRVNSFAIIDSLTLGFGPGLNVLTGETGAGKSIIIGALGLVLGERAYTEMIKTGRETATVEAVFELPGHPGAGGLGPDDKGLISIKRVISRGGKGRAYVNGEAVTVQALGELGKTLVDVHGQHEHQSILSAENQALLLDTYAGLTGERDEVRRKYEACASIRRKLDALRRSANDREQRADFLRFQVGEIEAAGLSPLEDAALEEEFGLLNNAGRLRELVEGAYDNLYTAEGSAVERSASARSSIQEAAETDNSLAELADSLAQAAALMEDAAFVLRDIRDRYEADPARLDHVQERIEEIKRLKKKYGKSIEDVLRYVAEASEELYALENAQESAEGLQKELDAASTGLGKAAKKLSDKRKKAATALEEAIAGQLKSLALENSVFKVSFEQCEPGPTGMDEMEFLFSANRGEMVKPLSKVASGGELSRIMLAIKTVLREADSIPVLVFDEVDAGIGGKTANNVAEKLRDTAGSRQVLCISHLPQIAAKGDTHLFIEKSSKKDATIVGVHTLTGQDRTAEIARMLSGSVTDTSLKHARELLGEK